MYTRVGLSKSTQESYNPSRVYGNLEIDAKAVDDEGLVKSTKESYDLWIVDEKNVDIEGLVKSTKESYRFYGSIENDAKAVDDAACWYQTTINFGQNSEVFYDGTINRTWYGDKTIKDTAILTSAYELQQACNYDIGDKLDTDGILSLHDPIDNSSDAVIYKVQNNTTSTIADITSYVGSTNNMVTSLTVTAIEPNKTSFSLLDSSDLTGYCYATNANTTCLTTRGTDTIMYW